MNITVSHPKRAFRLTVACIAVLSFLQFLIYYVCMGFFYESTAAIIISPYLINFFEALFPVACALIIYLTTNDGIKNKILPMLLISLSRITYTFPYYYIYYVSDVFDSLESVLLSLLVSILYISSFFLQTFICISLINYAKSRVEERNKLIVRAKLFNIEDRTNFGILICVFFIFIIFLVRELINTVSFFREVGGSYYFEEILTIVLSYVILPVFAFTHYAICVFIKNKLIKNTSENPD